jgi:hypothetical protein
MALMGDDMRWMKRSQELLVTVPPDRAHTLSVEQRAEELVLRAVVLKRVSTDIRPIIDAALRNAVSVLHGLRVEGRQLIGECSLPRVGLTAEEFQTCARHLAQECDRLEYLNTGRDAEEGL